MIDSDWRKGSSGSGGCKVLGHWSKHLQIEYYCYLACYTVIGCDKVPAKHMSDNVTYLPNNKFDLIRYIGSTKLYQIL